MPRIEYIPINFNFDSGDGTPVVDVCNRCAGLFVEGDCMPDKVGEGKVGFTDVDHPPYDECDYPCEVCGKKLTEKDDWE